MTTVEIEPRETNKRKTPLIVAGLAVVLAALLALPLLLGNGQGSEVADPDEVALQNVADFVAAFDAGDADAAMALMGPEQQGGSILVHDAEFFAAIPGPKKVTDCSIPNSFMVSCTLHLDGPLFQATNTEAVRADFSVKDGRVTAWTPGGHAAAGAAFVEYASTTQPETFDRVCRKDAYDPGSVRDTTEGFVFTGECGSLWAQVADDAAAWVEAGKPALGEEG